MTTVLAVGDSFIFGNELNDWVSNPREHSEYTFTALLAKKYNFNYKCGARPGISNDAIMRLTISNAESLKNNFICIVAWTFPPRFEFPFNFDIDSPDSPFTCISVWPDTNRPMVQDFAKFFVKHVNMNWYPYFKTLQSIIVLQNYLKHKNIPYIFTCADNSVFHATNSEDLQPFYNLLDYDNWYFFPPAEESYNTTTPRGFYQWAVENKYSCGIDQHPLEQAHHDAATLIQGKFDELVKNSLE